MKKIKILVIGLIFVLIGSISAVTRWEREYPELATEYGISHLTGICETYDKGFAFISMSYIDNDDMMLVRVDSLGNLLWVKKIFSSGPEQDDPTSIKETPDKGFIIVGISDYPYQATLIKTDSLGNVIKDTAWIPQGCYLATLYDVTRTSDNNWIAVGFVKLNDETLKTYIVKFNDELEIEWERFYSKLCGQKIRRDGENYILFTAGTSIFRLVKINQNGDTLWCKKYTGNDLNWYWFSAYDVAVTTDGYLITGGRVKNMGGSPLSYLLETDKNGNLLWFKVYPLLTDSAPNDRGKICWQTDDGGYLMIAEAPFEQQIWIVKIGPNRDTLWTKRYSVEGNIVNKASQAWPTKDSGIIIGGSTAEDFGVNHRVYLIKTDKYGNVGIEEVIKEKEIVKISYLSYRLICFEGQNNTEIEIYNILGQRIIKKKIENGRLIINLSHSGIYFWKTNRESGKIVLLK